MCKKIACHFFRLNKVKKASFRFLKFAFLTGLIFSWLFSGWPQIWNFPPKVQEVYAAVAFHTYVVSTQSNGTTGFTITIPATIATGEDLYILVSSRDHTSGTALVTVTDNDTGGNTWTREGGSTDRKLNVYWKKATSGTASKTITVAGCVGSCTGGMSAFTGGFSGDPTTNFVVEDNISGDETHAGFTPDNANSFIVFGITNPTNDTVVVTLLASANLGTLEPEQWAKGSTGGSDTYAIITGIAQVGAAAATGNFTWAQTDSITNSVSFAIKPIIAPTVTTQAANPVGDTTATCNGTITATGGANATAVGCEWDTDSGAPYANNPSTAGDYGVAPFTQSLTSLPSGTTIYARAFATNSAGTGYGSEVSFLTKPAAPTSVTATDGTYTDKVTITWTKSTGATNYHVWRDSTDLGAAGDVATFDDTGADAPTVTAGTASATDGSATDKVTLSISGASANNGTTHTYKVVASNATGNSADSATNTGYRGVGSLTYQWYRSSGTGDSGYSLLSGATTAPYDDATAPASTITAGVADASDGTSQAHVALSVSGQGANVGAVRYYYATVSATGASSQDTSHNDGYIGVGSLTYQWQRSAADSDASYSDISGATTASYNDTGAPADGSGRYFKVVENAAGATQQISTADRGYRIVGSINADIVNDSYVSVSSPTMSMNGVTFSLTCQTATGSFGTASQQIYVNNNNGANNGWTLTVAAQATTNVWDSVGTDYDFNDPTGSGCTDGVDAGDSVGGQMTIDPSVATLAIGQCGTCSTANVSKGSSAAFNEGTTDAITLLTATADSDDVGDWTLQGVSISQKIPAEQPTASDYDINIVLTVTAN